MAAGDRSKKIRIKVQTKLGDPQGIAIADAENVYDSLNRIQQIILEGAGASQVKATISVTSGVELYDFPDGFIAIQAILPGSTTPLQRLTMQEVEETKRVGTSLLNATSDPVYYYVFNGQIGFMNPAGGAPSGSFTITLWGWNTLKDDLSQDASDTIDPIVNRRWDTCLYYGTLWDMTLQPQYQLAFEQSLQRTRSFENSARDISYKIPYDTGDC